jgi:ABC-type Fe3+ transport system permease subunit
LIIALALRAIDAFRIFATPLVLGGVQGVPVLTSVAYYYKMDANDAAAANVAALTLAIGLLLASSIAFWLVAKRKGRAE